MSLDWDTTRLDPTKKAEVFPSDEAGLMNDALHVLIWLTIPVGMDGITESNVGEFWVRANLWQRAVGSGFTKAVPQDDGDFRVEPYLIEARHVRAAVGLRTNAASKTNSEFLRHLLDAARRTYLPMGG